MDFSSMYFGKDHPSDIDLLYIGRDKTLLIGELKNERGYLQEGQRRLLESLANGWKWDAVILMIHHSAYVQRGAEVVDVGRLLVSELYHKKERTWRRPKQATTVKQVVDYFKGGNE